MERLRARIKSLERENALLRESGREPAASGSEPGSGAAPGSRRGPLRDEERAVGVG